MSEFNREGNHLRCVHQRWCARVDEDQLHNKINEKTVAQDAGPDLLASFLFPPNELLLMRLLSVTNRIIGIIDTSLRMRRSTLGSVIHIIRGFALLSLTLGYIAGINHHIFVTNIAVENMKLFNKSLVSCGERKS